MLQLDFLILLVVIFVCISVVVYCFLSPLLRRRVTLDRVAPQRSMAEGVPPLQNWTGAIRNVAVSIGESLTKDEDRASPTVQRLIQAGIRNRDAVKVFTGVRMILVIAAILGAFFISRQMAASFALPAVFAGLIAMVLPDFWLRTRVSSRQRRIVWALPDFMDLMLVCAEAGLGLDQALSRVGPVLSRAHSDLSDELRQYVLQLNAGSTRAQALRGLANRTGVDELRSFAAILIQADRFGTSISRTLRVFSEDLRVRRRQAAEEAAAKLTVKLVIPLVVFIFPAILVVSAGPAVIAIFRSLFGALSGNR